MEFLKNNTNSNLQKQLDPNEIVTKVKNELDDIASSTNTEAPSTEDLLEKITNQPTSDGGEEFDAAGEESSDVTEPTEDSSVEVDDLVDDAEKTAEGSSIHENYKKLKSKYKETSKAFREREAELVTTKKKLDDYETGAIISPVLQDKENELQELRRKNALIDFKTSSECEQKYVKPIEEGKAKLKALTDAYNVPLEAVLSEKKTKSEADFNKFLSSYFDPVGALKIDGLVTNVQELEQQLTDAEKTPEKALLSVKQEMERVNQVREVERIGKVQAVARKSWVSALNKIKAEGKFKALIYTDDEQFNQNTVRPLITYGAQEFKKTIESLAQLGLKELPEDLAEVLARGHLYGTSSGLMSEVAMKAMEEAEAAKINKTKLFKVNRPSIGGGSPSRSGPSSQPAAATPKQAAEEITKKVLAARRS